MADQKTTRGYQCSSSITAARRTRPRSRCFSRRPASPYEPIPVDTRKGDQHKPDFLAINPNAKVPAIVDGDATVFDSSAILLYLGEKTGKFLPAKTDKARGELLSWMFFVASGVGPYSGQSVHFRVYAPEKIDYAINRYAYEAQRHFGIINERLGKNKYMLGDTYTIVDMNIWGWARLIPNVLGEKGWEQFPNLKRLDRRDQRASGRRARGRAEGQAQVQDRDGRRGEERHVQAPDREGGVATSRYTLRFPSPACGRGWHPSKTVVGRRRFP